MVEAESKHVVELSTEELAQHIQAAAKRLTQTRSCIYYAANPVGEESDEVKCPKLGRANGVILYVNELANSMDHEIIAIEKMAAAIERWAQKDDERDADLRMLRALLERVARHPQSPPRLVSDIDEALEATAYAEAAESEAVQP